MGTFTPHLDALPAAQRQIWPSLGPTAALGYVLYGGTALALRVGHRPSKDFDFFNDRPLDRLALSQALPLLQTGAVLQDDRETWSLLVAADAESQPEINVSFFGSLHLGRVGTPDRTSDGACVVASLDDLLATKLKVLLQRVEAKDYVDIATLIQQGVDLAYGLAAAQLLYSPAFQPSECLKALVYFQGGDLASLSQSIRETLIASVARVGVLPTVTRSATTLS